MNILEEIKKQIIALRSAQSELEDLITSHMNAIDTELDEVDEEENPARHEELSNQYRDAEEAGACNDDLENTIDELISYLGISIS